MGSVCYWGCLFLGWWLFWVFDLFVCGLVVIFGIWFVCWLVGGSVWYLVCVFVGW